MNSDDEFADDVCFSVESPTVSLSLKIKTKKKKSSKKTKKSKRPKSSDKRDAKPPNALKIEKKSDKRDPNDDRSQKSKDGKRKKVSKSSDQPMDSKSNDKQPKDSKRNDKPKDSRSLIAILNLPPPPEKPYYPLNPRNCPTLTFSCILKPRTPRTNPKTIYRVTAPKPQSEDSSNHISLSAIIDRYCMI